MSDTPRTDAAILALGSIPTESAQGAEAGWNLAAELERELAAAQAERDEALRTAEHDALMKAASRVRNATHTCMSEKHCDFLHAAHEKVAKNLEEEARAALAKSEGKS